MENTNDQTVEETTDIQEEVVETIDTEVREEPKKPLTPEQRRGILKRQLTKLNKELGIEEESPKKEEIKKEIKSNKLDYGQLAYLEAKGINGDEKIEWIEKHCQRTGQELKDALKDGWVQSQLKSIDDKKVVEDATPTSTNRASSTGSAKNTVDYWIKNGGLPEDRELANKVVNEKIRLHKSGDVFSKQSLVSSSRVINK